MADRPFQLVLDPREELDTSMPVSDRKPGTLIDATDCHPHYWGPREGNQAFTRVWEGPGTGSLYGVITLLATVGHPASGYAVSYEDAFGDLGTTFTLDLWPRLLGISYASAVNRIGVYTFRPGGAGGSGAGIDICVFGGNHTDHERVEVKITTSSSRTVANSPVSFTGATRLSYGSAQTDIQHIRVVRDGKYGYLYLNGVLDGSTSSLSATAGINRTLGDQTLVQLGGSGNGDLTLYGNLYGAALRDGAFTSQPIEARMPCAPWARNVHHLYLGRDCAMGGVTQFYDAGRFGAHAAMGGAGAINTDWTVTASNFDAAPTPSPVQGIRSWTSRANRTATSVLAGGILSTAGVT